jgi:hypothetical protein
LDFGIREIDILEDTPSEITRGQLNFRKIEILEMDIGHDDIPMTVYMSSKAYLRQPSTAQGTHLNMERAYQIA